LTERRILLEPIASELWRDLAAIVGVLGDWLGAFDGWKSPRIGFRVRCEVAFASQCGVVLHSRLWFRVHNFYDLKATAMPERRQWL